MQFSVSRIALIGSLRSRIVIIISLLTIAVQLTIYSIVDGTNQDFYTAHEASVLKRVIDVAPAVVNTEFKSLDYELLDTTKQLSELAITSNNVSDAIALINKRNATSLSTDHRYLLLTNSNGLVLYNGNESAENAENAAVHDIAAAPVDTIVYSGFFD